MLSSTMIGEPMPPPTSNWAMNAGDGVRPVAVGSRAFSRRSVLRDDVQVAVDGDEGGEAGAAAPGVVGVVDGHRPDHAALQVAHRAVAGGEEPDPPSRRDPLTGPASRIPPCPLMYCFSTATSSLPADVGHGRTVQVTAGPVVPDDLEVAAAHAVHVAGPGADVDDVVQQGDGDASRTRLPPWAEASPGSPSSRRSAITFRRLVAVPAPAWRRDRACRTNPLSTPAYIPALVEEAATVHVAAVAARSGARAGADLLARAERDGPVAARGSGRSKSLGKPRREPASTRYRSCRRARAAGPRSPSGCS